MYVLVYGQNNGGGIMPKDDIEPPKNIILSALPDEALWEVCFSRAEL